MVNNIVYYYYIYIYIIPCVPYVYITIYHPICFFWVVNMALFSPQKNPVGWAMTGVGSSSGNHVPFPVGRRVGARVGRALGVEKPQRFIKHDHL